MYQVPKCYQPSCKCNKGPGRPRQKRLRRKLFRFPRQVNSEVKTQMLRAASIVQKGMFKAKYTLSVIQLLLQHPIVM